MADRHDYVALEWVKGEIETTLDLARQALETYVEDTQDSTQLGFCFNYLHQVHGTLQMVEFYGAALLSEELEKLAQKLVDQQVDATEDILSILMEGILQLPNYLDKVKTYQQDLPIVLLPIINEIRTVCDEGLMSASVLFQPNLSHAHREFTAVAPAYEQGQFLDLAKKLRQMYQVALLGLLKNQEIEKNLAYLEKVLSHLNKHCANTPLSVYWALAQAMVAGLQDESITLSIAVKDILKHVDQSIKSVVEAPVESLSRPVSDDQLKNILFYIAKAQSNQAYILAAKKDYQLSEALPNIEGYTSENAMAGPDKDAMHSVMVALTEETTKIKEHIEALASQGASNDDLLIVKEAIKPIGDTMAALGLTELRKVLLDQYNVLEQAEQNAQMLNEAQLMEMAGGLLFVESSMKGDTSHADGAPISMSEGVSDAHSAVIREARNGLEQTKDAIVEYIGSQWDVAKIAEVPSTLKEIGGGLKMIPLQKASNILDACEQYFVENLIENKQVPQWNELDQLADALMGIEYYLERLTQDGRGSNESLLNTSQERMESLGIRVATVDIETEDVPDNEHDAADMTVLADDVPVLESPIEDGTEIPEQIEVPVLREEQEEHVSTQSTNEALDEDDDLIDDEILEIFIEEAHEVLEAIHEFLPKYKANQNDTESLTEFRRAYHTLKGSGRMVGANDIGELAWSIESMLNKHIEGSVQYSQALIQIVEEVTDYVPTLVKQFENREPADLSKIEQLTNRANAIASGELGEDESIIAAEDGGFVEALTQESQNEVPVLEVTELEDEIVNETEPESTLVNIEELPTLELVEADTDELEGHLEISDDDNGIDFELEDVTVDESELTLEEVDDSEPQDVPVLSVEPIEEEQEVPELSLDNAPLLEEVEPINLDESSEQLLEVTSEEEADLELTLEEVDDSEPQDVPVLSVEPIEEEQEVPELSLDNAPLLEEIEPINLDGSFEQSLQEALEQESDLERALEPAQIDDDLESITSDDAKETLEESLIEFETEEISEDLSLVEDVALQEATDEPLDSKLVVTDQMLGINDEQRDEKIHSDDPDFVEYEVDEDSIDNLFGEGFDDAIEDEASEGAALKQSVSDDTVDDLDDQSRIFEIFTEELATHLQTVKQYLDVGAEQDLSEELQRAFHTIKGAAHMAGVMQLAEAMAPVEKLVQTMYQLNVQSDDDILEVLKQSVERCEHALTDVTQFLVSDESSQGFATYVHSVMQRHIEAKSETLTDESENPLQTFLTATMDLIIDSEDMTADWQGLPIEQTQLIVLHTNMTELTQSAQTCGQFVFESLSLKLANLYQFCLDNEQKVNDQFVELAKLAQETLVNLMDRLAAAQSLDVQNELELKLEQFIAEHSLAHTLEVNELDSQADAPIDIEFKLTESEATSFASNVHKKHFVVSADDDLVEIFTEEASELVENVRVLLTKWQENTDDLSLVENLQRDLHTIKGGARMAEIGPLGDLTHELEFLYEGICNKHYIAQPSIFDILFACQDDISDMVQDIEAQGAFEYDPSLIDAIKQYCDEHKAGHMADSADELAIVEEPSLDAMELALVDEPEMQIDASGIISSSEEFVINSDSELIDIFLEEADEILESIQHQFNMWKQNISSLAPVQILQRDLHTLKGGARMSGISPVGDLGHELEYLYEGIVNHKYNADEALIELIESCHNSLSDMIGDIQANMRCKNDRFLLECVQNYCAGNGFSLPDDHSAPSETNDESLISIFVKETQALLGELAQARLAWRYTPKDSAQSDTIKRVLHTIKGGAKLAEQNDLAQSAEEAELFVMDCDGQALNDAFFDQLDAMLIQLDENATTLINEHINNDQSNSEEVGSQIDQWMAGDATEANAPISIEESIKLDTQESKGSSGYDNVIEFDSTVLTDIKRAMQPKTAMDIADEAKRLAGEQEAFDKKRRNQNQETVKVQANILDGLVNLAGETSISRARLEQEVTDFNFTLSEMNSAIDRMNEQIRRLDNETQEQVTYRQEQAEEELEEFDPLEMDRYSSIQQLSRSIMESASDLMDLQDTLKERTRDTETILLQQSRINTELQEGLMQTRMVPFSGIAPRLRRIVRQTSGELNKKAELEFYNIDGEVDRTVLERMVAPLEHMLRNSIDHGIEMPAQRLKEGKAKAGKVELSLTREGSYMVLTLRDDGSGIDISKIREKAVEKGLMTQDANLTDQEILMFILDAGFSTADKVTQISGRGVGMDVVNSEVKQLGGVMNIDSTIGKGTLFTIRIPVTVSLSRALMVSIEDDIYALPLNTIEGIVRVSPAQMQQFYQPDAPKFRYAGQDYRVQYLGSLMDENKPAHIPSDVAAIPLILVHGVDNDHTLALHVDQLLGSREIVVKSMGPQFTSVTGLTGATILGDGSVVVILDLPSMIRSAIATDHQMMTSLQVGVPEKEEVDDRAKRVMVVDDSVTVRKVTSRLLERNGYEVILAKDGQDAVTQLQDVRPDIMLLDIEMPRMDGFEVATRVRHSPDISDLPIIMITSRTGEKHKERALSIGVNEYLGKPFQEGPLLEIIKEQLEMVKA